MAAARRVAASATHFAVVAASCVFAGLIVDRFVVASLLTPRAPMRRVTVEVAGPTRNVSVYDEARISRIVRDGTLVRFDTLELTGEWEQTADPKYPHAVPRSGPAASISFDASQAIVEFMPSPVSSQATLRSGGDPPQHVDLQVSRWGFPKRILGTSGGHGHWWTLVAVAAAIVGLAFVVRPLRDPRRAQILVGRVPDRHSPRGLGQRVDWDE